MISKFLDKALKSYNSNKKSMYLNSTKKKQSFTSPAIKVIEDIVSKNKFLKTNGSVKNKQLNLLKRNKNLNNYVQQVGSLVVTAANQKSYHRGSFSTNKTLGKEDKSISEHLKQMGNDVVSNFNGFNSWVADKYNTVKKGTTSWVSNNYEYSKKQLWSGLKKAGAWTADKYNASTAFVSNNYEYSKKQLWSGLKKAGAWTADKYNASTAFVSNNYEYSKKQLWSGLKKAGAWTAGKYNSGIKAGKNIMNASKDWYFNSKKEIGEFFDTLDIVNKSKEFGQKVLEGIKNYGYGLSYKMQDIWDHPWTKRTRKIGNGIFKIFDIIGNVNKVVQATTPEEKIVEVSKIVGAKIGSIALGTGLGALGGIIPGAQPAIPILVGAGAYLGDKGGEKLGEWGGNALNKILPRNWWPFKASSKKNKTSSLDPTKNIGIDKSKKNSILSSSSNKSKQIHVNLPNGAIQISNNNSPNLDYSSLVDQISTHFVKELRKAMQNRKTIMA
ncbi:hypothetical protein [Paenibacillus illinoisensis]|uniref:hypothetical protein n=1 Tax=Paenibacillus illinoisensis TaxID=59845 RepID=UPI00203A6FA5|nr:hypothetical protein [Paenibacillus illinoisensis]MCM3204397.1 hypothetical protein [Paenibacillus illinoisensis]